MDADSIRIETDEDGFWLEVYPEAPAGFVRYRITDPEGFYDHVKAAIGPWLYERDMARVHPHDRAIALEEQARELFACDPDESGGMYDAHDAEYRTSDPKHPAFHSTHADIWDNREKDA